jgi:ferredoxin
MKFITREDLSLWLDHLAQKNTLVAPREVEGVLLYRPVKSSSEVTWDYIRPILSAKESLFPGTERLLVIEKTGQEVKLTESAPDGKQIVFGIRPCDARGLSILDSLFIDTEPIDTYYAHRRENTTLIGLACQQMAATCFCTSVGGAPDDPTGMDIMLTEGEGGYFIDPITEKGARLVEESRLQTSQYPNIPDAQSQLPKHKIPEMGAWPPQFNDTYWSNMAERCLSCRICAYVCPTCRCFDVRDEVLASDNGHKKFERIRCWDSCASETYRRIAGGHNPRAEKGERLRNRFYCKFYYYPQQYGPIACTGCGRCIDSCPVNIDITEVMDHLVEVSP